VALDRSPVSWEELRGADASDLEKLYRDVGVSRVPRGIFAGRHLAWVETRDPTAPLLRPVLELFFRRLEFHIDFDRSQWFWFARSLGVGHFSPSIGPSRWRDTETIRMLYDDRRLPGFVNQWLYDEVKPLSDDLGLGLGGISRRRGEGERFFFALRRIG